MPLPPMPADARAGIAWEDPHGCLWQGDVRAMLAELPAESVQCVITSPPYWGLRAYGCAPQVWGGDPDCDHGAAIADEVGSALDALWAPAPVRPPLTGGTGPTSGKQLRNQGSQFGNAWVEETRAVSAGLPSEKSTLGIYADGTSYYKDGWESAKQAKLADVDANRVVRSATCTRCGAWRGELGSEPLHDCAGWATGAPCGACFICHLVEVFRAVWRVLRADGVCLVNIGDSYANTGVSDPTKVGGFTGERIRAGVKGIMDSRPRAIPPGLKPKDLVGIPWRFALALQADGWWLRGDYIWSKPNPMPESVTDRCTRSHEYVFHFTKSDRYFWDADAVREASTTNDPRRPYTSKGAWELDGRPDEQRRGGQRRDGEDFTGRNARSVWTIPTEAFPGAHFATFPRALVRRAIQAGTSERGACAACGAPWVRVTERTAPTYWSERKEADFTGRKVGHTSSTGNDLSISHGRPENSGIGYRQTETTGWQPTCPCPTTETRPCIVLDPFVGSGTTIAVARQLGRIGWGIELQPDYVDIAIRRLQQMVLL